MFSILQVVACTMDDCVHTVYNTDPLCHIEAENRVQTSYYNNRTHLLVNNAHCTMLSAAISFFHNLL